MGEVNAVVRFDIEDVCQRLGSPYKFRRPSTVCIYKVPTYLKDQNNGKQHYVPQTVGLGPYHHNAGNLRGMEDHKFEAVRRTFKAFLKKHGQPGINLVIAEIKNMKEDIKGCYEDEDMLKVDEGKLASMFILDGCFILEICKNQINVAEKEQSKGRYVASWNDFDPVFSPQRLEFIQGFLVLDDIIKLENQIPIMVLKKLLELELACSADAASSDGAAEEKLFQYLHRGLLKACNPFNFPEDEKSLREKLGESRHILEFLFKRITEFISPPGAAKELGSSSALKQTISIPPAAVLDDAGINFQPITDSSVIQFKKTRLGQSGTVYLPKVRLSLNSEVVLRNLIALEECRAVKENLISRYMALIDDLVDSETDVALLRKKGILDSQLGSDGEAADLLNSLCTAITRNFIPQIDTNVVQLVKEHYNSKFKVLLGEFIKQHFSKPWYVVILAAAILQLGMTAVQTYYGIFGKK